MSINLSCRNLSRLNIFVNCICYIHYLFYSGLIYWLNKPYSTEFILCSVHGSCQNCQPHMVYIPSKQFIPINGHFMHSISSPSILFNLFCFLLTLVQVFPLIIPFYPLLVCRTQMALNIKSIMCCPVLLQVKSDFTRYCYGDEQHLDDT